MAPPKDYVLAFADEFDTLSASTTRTATANWYAGGLPWGGGFGSAAFRPPGGADSPFAIVSHGGATALEIEMTRDASGRLTSGLLSSVFPDGTSRIHTDGDPYGYYELRLWMPQGGGVWPAFWAMEKERLSAARDKVVEIDVVEQHGTALADRFSSNVHVWDWNNGRVAGHTMQPHQEVVGRAFLESGWHVYGVDVRPDTITFTVDGRPHHVVATPAALDTDLAVILDLAAGGGWPVDPALKRATMYVDYVRVYDDPDSGPGPGPGPDPDPDPGPAPVLTGTARDDTFQVSVAGTRIVEGAGGGYDTVRSSVGYVLPENVEKLVLNGTAALDGTGNGAGNQLFGNAAANALMGLAGDDFLFGQGGADTLDGGAGNDKLYGGDGADRLVGGAGSDRLQGDAGADTFVFLAAGDSPAGARDTVVDFSAAAGDRLDLRGVDANALVAGDQAFAWIGAQPFGAAGQLRFADGVLSGDLDGDRVADFAVNLGAVAIAAKDILL